MAGKEKLIISPEISISFVKLCLSFSWVFIKLQFVIEFDTYKNLLLDIYLACFS